MKVKDAMRICVLVLILCAHNPHADTWEAPFDQAIAQFLNSNFTKGVYRAHKFARSAKKLSSFIQERQKDWDVFVQPIERETLFSFRSFFHRFDYVGEIFQTKPRTLVFTTNSFPNIVIKIDHRVTDDFGLEERSYYDAFLRSRDVLKHNHYKFLYFPREHGVTFSLDANVKQHSLHDVRLVLSEKIPMFSTIDVENIILLHRFISVASMHEALREQLKAMYLEMIDYICRNDFDDISVRNMPFVNDGRLAPFDTDTGSARTGVYAFLSQFYAVSLFENDLAIKEQIRKSCHMELMESINPFSKGYDDIPRLTKNEAHLNAMVKYFADHPADQEEKEKLALHVPGDLEDVAKIFDGYVHETLRRNKGMSIFGQRCEHARDLVTHVADKIRVHNKDLFNEAADEIVIRLLTIARENKVVMASGDVKSLVSAFKRDLLSYICF